MLPPAAAEQLDEMSAPAFGEAAPFLRGLVEYRRKSCRHRGAVPSSRTRRAMISLSTRGNDTLITELAEHESTRTIVARSRKKASAAELSRANKTDPPGRGKPGGSR